MENWHRSANFLEREREGNSCAKGNLVLNLLGFFSASKQLASFARSPIIFHRVARGDAFSFHKLPR